MILLNIMKLAFWTIVLAFLVVVMVHPELLIMGDW